ncbi:MAG: hypothetical protein ABJC04_11835 [Verrucomicrobiota bacterium]
MIMTSKLTGHATNWARNFTLTALLLTLAFSPTRTTRAAVIAYEGFDYPAGDSIVGKTGGIGFTNAWQLNSSTGIQTNQATSLSYTDGAGKTLVTTGGSLFLQGTNAGNTGNTQPNRAITNMRGTNVSTFATDGVTTWVSFLIVRQGPTTNSPTVPDNPYPRSANLSLFNGLPLMEKLAMGNTSDTVSNVVTLLPVGGNAKPTSVSFSQTNFIVVRIDHKLDALDDAYMFVNPLLSSEPSISSADTNSIGQFDFSFNRIRPFAGGNRTTQPYAEIVVDEIRIGETYADVAPIISLPTLSITRDGNSVVLTWPGAFNLQSSTNVAGPYVTISGATSSFTNAITEPAQFFRLSSAP